MDEVFRRLVKAAPNDTAVVVNHAIAIMYRGKVRDAIKLLEVDIYDCFAACCWVSSSSINRIASKRIGRSVVKRVSSSTLYCSPASSCPLANSSLWYLLLPLSIGVNVRAGLPGQPRAEEEPFPQDVRLYSRRLPFGGLQNPRPMRLLVELIRQIDEEMRTFADSMVEDRTRL